MKRRQLLVAVPLALAVGLLAVPASASAAAAPPARHPAPPRHGLAAAAAAGASTARAIAGPSAVAPLATSPITGPAVLFGILSPVSGRTIFARDLGTQVNTAILPFSTTDCPDQPKLSPDGTEVAYLRAQNDPDCDGHLGLDPNGAPVVASLVVVDIASGVVSTLVTPAANQYIDLPNWHPNGTKILYTLVQDDAAGNFVDSGLLTVPAGGGAPTGIAGGGQHAYDGVYSPDGSSIAFAPIVPATAKNLSVMDADGSNVVDLPHTALGASFSSDLPSWSPDGLKLAFQYDKAPLGNALTYGLGVVTVATETDAHGLAVPNQAGWTSYATSWTPDNTEIFFDNRMVDRTTGFPATNTRISAMGVNGTRVATVVASPTDVLYSPSFVGPAPAPAGASTFTPITPTRVLAQTPVGQGGFVDVTVAGTAGIPSGATAVTLNLTGVNATKSTYLQVYPTPASGTAVPKVSNVNLTPGDTAAVAVQATVGAGGKVRVRNNVGTTGVVVDVSGYFVPGTTDAGFKALASPTRKFDGTVPQAGQHDVDVSTGAPANAVAVVVNVTAASPTKLTYLTVYPTPASPGPPPLVSTLNLPAHATRANLATVPIGAGGSIRVFNHTGSTRAIIDVAGYYVASGSGGLAYHPLVPTRVLDTRFGTGTLLGSAAPLGQKQTLDLAVLGTTTTDSGIVRVPPSGAVAVLNVTAVSPSQFTYVTVYPSAVTGSPPLASNLNPAPGRATANLVVSGIGAGGGVRMYNNAGSVPLVADLSGYFG